MHAALSRIRTQFRGVRRSMFPTRAAPARLRIAPSHRPAMSSAHFDLVSHWRIAAPVDRAWAALTDVERWPVWWPCVRSAHVLRHAGPDDSGSIHRICWETRIAREVVIQVEAVELLPQERIRVRSRGPLDGEGIWLLREERGSTDITCVWRIELAARWMRWIAPLLVPVVRWNHDGVMRAGEAGLARHLAATRASHASGVPSAA
jgi:uncharacterized protein YndB with AHSA1/START domain